MAGTNSYDVDILLEIKAKGAEQAALVNAALAGLKAQIEQVNESLKRAREQGDLHSQMLSRISLNTQRTAEETGRLAQTLEQKLTPALKNSGAASGGAHSGFQKFVNAIVPGGNTAASAAIGIAALAAIFPTLTIELAASLVLLGAWVVGAMAFAAVIGIAVGGIALLAAAVLYLGIQNMGGLASAAALTKAQNQATAAANANSAAQETLAKAQLAYDTKPTAMNLLNLQHAQEQAAESAQKLTTAQNNLNAAQAANQSPIALLQQHASAAKDALGQSAAPLAAQMVGFADQQIPKVQALGQSLIDWFGPRLDGVLTSAGQAIDNLLAGFNRLGEGWGKVIDHVMARSPEFGSIINGAFNRVIDAALGLLENLVKVSDWFVARLPVLGPVVNSTFANIGIVIQAVGRGLGAFVDWVIAHWPAINHAFDATWNAIKLGWQAISPVFQLLAKQLSDLQPYFKYIEDNAKNLLPVFVALGAVVAIIIVVLAALGIALILVVVGIVWLAAQITKAVHESGDQFSALGTTAHRFLEFVKSQLAEAGAQFSALGTTARAVVNAIGAFFSGFGSAVQAGLSAIGGFFSKVGAVFHLVVNVIRDAFGLILTIWLTIGAVLLGAWLSFWEDVYKAVEPYWNRIRKVVGDALNAIWSVIVQIWNIVVAFLEHTWASIYSRALYWWNFLQLAIWTVQTAIQGFITPIWNAIVSFLESVWANVYNRGLYWWNFLQLVIWTVQTAIQADIKKVWDAIHNFLDGAWNRIHSTADSWWNTIYNAITGWATKIKSFVSDIWDSMVKTAQGIGSQLSDAIKSGLNDAIGVADDFILKARDFLHTFHVSALDKTWIPKLAKGGVIPGYAPGQDSVLAMLSPGEGVLTPQTTAALGGKDAIDALNNGGLGGLGGIAASIGTWGGQCVAFIQRVLGLSFRGNANQWVNAPYAHTQTARAGEVAVFTGGPFGHVAILTGSGDGFSFPVIDSNWVANETIGQHVMNKAMYGFNTFLDVGQAAIGALAGIPGVTVPVDFFNGLVTSALGSLGGWQGGVAKELLGMAVKGAPSLLGFDQGGSLPPGGSMVWNGTGRSEPVLGPSAQDDIHGMRALMVEELRAIHEVLQELRVLNGRQRSGALTAVAQIG